MEIRREIKIRREMEIGREMKIWREMEIRSVPWRLFFAAQQRIAITLSPTTIKKCSVSQRERIKKNMAQMSCKFREIIKKL